MNGFAKGGYVTAATPWVISQPAFFLTPAQQRKLLELLKERGKG